MSCGGTNARHASFTQLIDNLGENHDQTTNRLPCCDDGRRHYDLGLGAGRKHRSKRQCNGIGACGQWRRSHGRSDVGLDRHDRHEHTGVGTRWPERLAGCRSQGTWRTRPWGFIAEGNGPTLNCGGQIWRCWSFRRGHQHFQESSFGRDRRRFAWIEEGFRNKARSRPLEEQCQ